MPHKKPHERIPTELPLAKYVPWALQKNHELYEPPSRGSAFRTPTWEFVRLCKAHPALKGKSAIDAFRVVDKIKLNDGQQGFPWEEFDSDDPQTEFVATWDKIRIPAGADILALAIASAKERPLKPRIAISQGYCSYVSIAGRLQELRPNDHINLPVERLAEALGVNPRMISYYAQFAQTNGLITRLAKAHKPSGQTAKYVFHRERFDMETGEELPAAAGHHFHKDSKDVKEIQESKDNHEQEKTGRTSEESKRHSGEAGLLNEKKGNGGKLGALRAKTSYPSSPSGRREELKQQGQFLERNYQK